jgi:Protein of unknown function (DUF3098)
MAVKKEIAGKTGSTKKAIQVVDHSPLFGKTNYLLMVAGAVVIALGMILMSGGKSADPNVFDPKEVYSTTRVTIAPVLIVLGLVLEVYAIFRKK